MWAIRSHVLLAGIPLIGPVTDRGGPAVGGILALVVLPIAIAIAAVVVYPTARSATERSFDRVHSPTHSGDEPTDRDRQPAEGWAVTAVASVLSLVVAVALVLVFVVGVLPLLGFLWLPVLGLALAVLLLALASRRGWWTNT